MNILGLDLATTSTGFAVLNGDKLIVSGTIQPPKDNANPLARITYILNEISKIYEEYNIEYTAIEDIGLSYSINLEVAKNNLLLIGGCIALSNKYKAIILLLKASEWRKIVGIYDDKVSKEEMKREYQKKKGIEYANKYFNFSFEWVSDYQDKKTHESDIAEATLIALACYKFFS